MALAEQEFDVVCLDLTGPADEWLRRIVKAYYHGCVIKEGALIVTFCYGRDVIEVYQDEWEYTKAKRNYSRPVIFDYLEKTIPEIVAMRVWYLLRGQLTNQLDSCLQYRGGMMPMVSCLLRKGHAPPGIGFESLAGRDYALAANDLDFGKVCACPADYLQELRARNKRSEAAYKAVETRRLRENKQPELRLVPQPLTRLAQIEQLWADCTADERAEVWKILHKLYTERKTIELGAPDVRARAALMADIRADRDATKPGA
jgi:hypothetical protein